MPPEPTTAPPPHGPPVLSEEARWVAWQARSAKEDMAVRRRMRVVLPLLALGAAGLFYVVMVR
jgi:hypothetical protein